MGRGDLIGHGEKHLIPPYTPGEDNMKPAPEGKRVMPTLAPGAQREARTPAPARGGRPNALTGSMTARATVETKARPAILDTIKVKPKAARPAAGKGRR